MAYSDIPAAYQPKAVRHLAGTIATALTQMATANRPRADKEATINEYIAAKDQGQEGTANDLMRIVIERSSDSAHINKAKYMLQTARAVFHSEIIEMGDQARNAGERQAAIDLGLLYYVHHPQTFLASLDTIARPDQKDVVRATRLLKTPGIARYNYYRELPAPAALATIGVVNALTFIDQIYANGLNPQAVPYYLSIAAAWNQIGNHLAGPQTPVPAKTKTGPDNWPPPWLEFIEDLDF